MNTKRYKVRCQRIKARAEQTQRSAEQIVRFMENIIVDADFNKQIQAKAMKIQSFAIDTAEYMKALINDFSESSCGQHLQAEEPFEKLNE